MSSNQYAACVSQNLVRTSTFGYHEQAMVSTKVLFSGGMHQMPPVGMTALTAGASQWKAQALPTP